MNKYFALVCGVAIIILFGGIVRSNQLHYESEVDKYKHAKEKALNKITLYQDSLDIVKKNYLKLQTEIDSMRSNVSTQFERINSILNNTKKPSKEKLLQWINQYNKNLK